MIRGRGLTDQIHEWQKRTGGPLISVHCERAVQFIQKCKTEFFFKLSLQITYSWNKFYWKYLLFPLKKRTPSFFVAIVLTACAYPLNPFSPSSVQRLLFKHLTLSLKMMTVYPSVFQKTNIGTNLQVVVNQKGTICMRKKCLTSHVYFLSLGN